MKKIALITLFLFFGLTSQSTMAAPAFRNRLQSITMPSVTVPKMPQRLQPYKGAIKKTATGLGLLYLATVIPFNMYYDSSFDTYFKEKINSELKSSRKISEIYTAIRNNLDVVWIKKERSIFLNYDNQNQVKDYHNLPLETPFPIFNKPKKLIIEALNNPSSPDYLKLADNKPVIVTFPNVTALSEETMESDIHKQALQQGLIADNRIFEERIPVSKRVPGSIIFGYNNLGVIYKEIARQYKSLYQSKAFKSKAFFFYMFRKLNPLLTLKKGP